MSIRLIDLPAAPSMGLSTLVPVVVPNVINVAGCSGDYTFFNGQYYMASDGIYYKDSNDGSVPYLKKYQLFTHNINHGPPGHVVQTPQYDTRYGIYDPSGQLYFQSVGYPSTAAQLDSVYDQVIALQDGGGNPITLDPPSITSLTGIYGQTFSASISAVLNLVPFANLWTDHVNAVAHSLSDVYDLGVINAINLQSGRPFRVGGLQVIGDQQAAIADATTLTAVARLNDILAALRAHGLIAT